MISGFSFIHDAYQGGIPIAEAIAAVRPYVDEVVVVDMQSTDGTRELLQQLEVRILDGHWGNQAGETLRMAHSRYTECKGDIILHFEGDEIYEDRLIKRIRQAIDEGEEDIAVYRLQTEQNFQKVKWYPELVHRIFPKWANTRKEGHTTNRHTSAVVIPPENGFLWDCCNIFRDNWIRRIENQAELWGEEPQYRMVPLHFLHKVELNREQTELQLQAEHWTWKTTPLNIPDVLKPLLGETKYKPSI